MIGVQTLVSTSSRPLFLRQFYSSHSSSVFRGSISRSNSRINSNVRNRYKSNSLSSSARHDHRGIQASVERLNNISPCDNIGKFNQPHASGYEYIHRYGTNSNNKNTNDNCRHHDYSWDGRLRLKRIDYRSFSSGSNNSDEGGDVNGAIHSSEDDKTSKQQQEPVDKDFVEYLTGKLGDDTSPFIQNVDDTNKIQNGSSLSQATFTQFWNDLPTHP